MKIRDFGFLAGGLAALMLTLMPVRSVAQQPEGKGKGAPKAAQKKGPEGPTPKTADGKPDFSGVWDPGGQFMLMGGPPPLQEWAAKVLKERRDTLSKDDPEGFCLPAGVPRISPFPYKIIQTAAEMVILDEGNIHSFREVYIGREHPKDPDPLWMGHSVAKWEGDTLVVDSVGFNDKTWLTGQGVPHTEKLHVIEKFSRPDLGTLKIEVTIEDPGAFTAPHTFTRTHILMPGADLLEYVCNEFNVDKDHLVGK